MRICPKCSFQNEDAALICAACSTSLPAQSSAMTDVDAFMADKARRKKTRTMMVAGFAAVAVIGAVVGGILMWKAQQNRMVHKKFYEDFSQADEKSYGDFWQCFYRDTTKQAFALQSNLVLYEKISKAFEANRKGYKTFVEDKCIPKIKEVPRRVSGLNPPSEYTAALEKYTKSSMKVEQATLKISEELGRLYEDIARDKKILAAADEWHKGYAPKDATKEAIVYDHFLRCAVPNYDVLKNGDELVAELQKQLKAATAYVNRLRTECYKLLDAPPAKPTPKYVEGFKKIGEEEDPRDIRAFKDFFKRANRTRESEILEPVGKVWLDYKDGRDEVLKVAAKVLQ
ncbi:MAG TPA: hypothetical protein VGQ83_11185 [Polyangia bacterium]|jgi:hypothetical protein